jgi:predicted metal-dependent hydrolase
VSAREYIAPSTILGENMWDVVDTSLQESLLLDIARPLCDMYSLRLWKAYHSLRCKNLRSKWGYCTHDNHIVLSTRLIHMPYEVVKYVVIHEVVHLVHKHHQKSFRFTVGELYPHYKDMRKYLRSIVID